MPAPLQRITTVSTLPKKTEVVVIGGGIVGVCAAYYLARRSVPVILLEKGCVGAEQSSRNWGWCRQQNRDARELPMANRSLSLWDRLRQDLGTDVGFRRCGLLYLSNDLSEIEGWAAWSRFAATQGISSQVLTAEQATKKGAPTGRRWKGGVYSDTDAIADPSRAAPLIAKGIEALGGRVLQNCAVRGVLTEAGHVSGVVTERGEVRARQVVMAGGAWASSFCNQLGIQFPQATVRASILSVAPGIEGLPDALHTRRASVTRRADGGHTLAISGRAQMDFSFQKLRFASHFSPMFKERWRSLSPGFGIEANANHETRKHWALDRETPMERVRTLDPTPDRKTVAETLRRARALLPALRQARTAQSWASFIDSTPDGVPVIDAFDALPGFYLAGGFSGHGFGIGPGAGHLVADLLTDMPPIVDPEPYRMDRLKTSARGSVAKY